MRLQPWPLKLIRLWGSERSHGLGLDTGEERQVERGGDLDGFQCEGRRVKREGDGIDHLRVHQQLGTLTTVPQASLKGERKRKKFICTKKKGRKGKCAKSPSVPHCSLIFFPPQQTGNKSCFGVELSDSL